MSRDRGFTLVEVMVAIALIIVIGSVLYWEFHQVNHSSDDINCDYREVLGINCMVCSNKHKSLSHSCDWSKSETPDEG